MAGIKNSGLRVRAEKNELSLISYRDFASDGLE